MNSASATKPGESSDHPGAALGHLASHIRFWIPTLLILWLDLWTKRLAFDSLDPELPRIVISGWLEFRRSLNDGAVFGSFAGFVDVFILASLFALGFVFYLFACSLRTQRGLHVALALILAGAVGNLYDRAFIVADVARITDDAGIERSLIGVMVDGPSEEMICIGDWPDGGDPHCFTSDEVTLRRQGVVRDFIKFLPRFPAWVPRLAGRETWPWVFNVADASLVCGVGLLLITCFTDRRPRER